MDDNLRGQFNRLCEEYKDGSDEELILVVDAVLALLMKRIQSKRQMSEGYHQLVKSIDLWARTLADLNACDHVNTIGRPDPGVMTGLRAPDAYMPAGITAVVFEERPKKKSIDDVLFQYLEELLNPPKRPDAIESDRFTMKRKSLTYGS